MGQFFRPKKVLVSSLLVNTCRFSCLLHTHIHINNMDRSRVVYSHVNL